MVLVLYIIKKMEGKVKFFNTTKGFGFIEPNEGDRDVFVHVNDLNGVDIDEGDKVTFDTEDTPKGKTAINVKLIEDDSSEESSDE